MMQNTSMLKVFLWQNSCTPLERDSLVGNNWVVWIHGAWASQVIYMWDGNVLAPCSLKRCSDVHVAMNFVKVIIKLSFQATFLSFISRPPPPTLLNTQWLVQGGWAGRLDLRVCQVLQTSPLRISLHKWDWTFSRILVLHWLNLNWCFWFRWFTRIPNNMNDTCLQQTTVLSCLW